MCLHTSSRGKEAEAETKGADQAKRKQVANKVDFSDKNKKLVAAGCGVCSVKQNSSAGHIFAAVARSRAEQSVNVGK